MFASSAIAGEPDGRVLANGDGVRTVAIRFEDLNLQTDAGNARLLSRLHQLAERAVRCSGVQARSDSTSGRAGW
jgi:UrcA family protein